MSHQRDDAAGERFIDNATTAGDRFVLWEVNGTPVSMAMLRAPAAGVSRIGPVFTPRSSRGRADLANPTSNAIYRRIGFEPVVDQVRIDFAVDGRPLLLERARTVPRYRRVLGADAHARGSDERSKPGRVP